MFLNNLSYKVFWDFLIYVLYITILTILWFQKNHHNLTKPRGEGGLVTPGLIKDQTVGVFSKPTFFPQPHYVLFWSKMLKIRVVSLIINHVLFCLKNLQIRGVNLVLEFLVPRWIIKMFLFSPAAIGLKFRM